MAGVANRIDINVICRPAGGAEPVVAIRAGAGYEVVAEVHRLPSQVRMAIGTFILYLNMVGRLPRCCDVVMAVAAESEYFMVIHSGHRLPILGVMARVATLTGVNMVDRLGSGVEAAVNAVAGDAFGRGTGELASGMTALAGNKVVTACELEAGLGVIERFFLGENFTAATQEH